MLLDSATTFCASCNRGRRLEGFGKELGTGDAGEGGDLGEVIHRHLFPLADRRRPQTEMFGEPTLSATIRFEVITEPLHGANFSQNEISVKKKFQSDAMV